MSDKLTAWIRNVVPAAWSALIAYLITLIPAAHDLAAPLSGLGALVLVPLVLAVYKAVVQRIETLLPTWLTRLLTGSTQTPTYPRTIPVAIVPPPASTPPAGASS
ncbi:hypothetical protein [Kutzneria buriramensis]|uniref:Uncharacterized protein n=1 Tax=Kutzneria buriramensis TaxID=1045776 RepID=A0A3E0HF26_9PSEU|nr:hypothetical protein [Kutzneria buriramensis]REH43656.1 hypothetical protein BCF44_109199 [Kutzneria buriramensis]